MASELGSLVQNSEEWLKWRQGGIGASDAPIIMEVSPYSTPYELWLEKTGQKKSFDGNYATERGQRLEPAARAVYEIFENLEMPPMLIEHRDFRFLRASLDGANIENKICLEIKCIGKETFHNARDLGVVPHHHWVQVQHQLLVSGFVEAHYFAYWNGEGALVKIQPDLLFFAELLKRLLIFWHMVETKTPPPFIELDYKNQLKAERKAKKEAKRATALVEVPVSDL